VSLAATVVSILSELYPRVMVSSLGSANDLTAANTASASYSLTVLTVVLAVLLPVVLGYQAWTYYVFRGRLRGPRVGDGEPGRAIPAPRGARATAGAPTSSDLTEDAESPAAPGGGAGSGAGGGRSGGTLPMVRLATGGLVLVLASLLLRQVFVSRAAPH
jgi:hypothetical protein